MYDAQLWQPTVSHEMLRKRAELLRSIREFFWQHDVLEVDTQLLSLASISDPHIEVLTTQAKCLGKTQTYYLQTSPEFAMKRLLCSGSGDIYQLSKVFRAEETSSRHSIEFTMLEWYRLGMNHWQLMAEIEALLVNVTGEGQIRCEYKSYAEAFQLYVGVDPFVAELESLQALAHRHTEFGLQETCRDTLLELLFSTLVEPNIGQHQPCFIHSYPPSQAALAKVQTSVSLAGIPIETAARFELYWKGMELANGYYELSDSVEQMQRMQLDLEARVKDSKPERQIDERLVKALEAGLPECSGVALGIDRLLMVLLEAKNIESVIPFTNDRA